MKNFQRSELEGKTFEEVVSILEAADCRYRIARKDGQGYMLTCDMVQNRYNLYIEDGIVVAFTQG